MNPHNEFELIFAQLIGEHPALTIILLFLGSTLAGVFRFAPPKPTYAVYHIVNALLFAIVWMLFSVHQQLDSFYAMAGLALGCYLGPQTLNLAARYLIAFIQSKLPGASLDLGQQKHQDRHHDDINQDK